MFFRMRTDLRIGVCNGCPKVRDSVRWLAMVCQASVVHVMPHVGCEWFPSCLRVFNRVDDETNASLLTLCQASWPMN